MSRGRGGARTGLASLLRLSALVAGATLGVASAVAAQAQLDVRITPRLGFVDPGAVLYATTVRSVDDYVISSSVSLEGRNSVGVALDVGSADRGVLLRLSVDRTLAMRSALTFTGQAPVLILRDVARSDTIPASLTNVGVELVLPLRLELGPVSPYVSAGVGARRYAFSLPDYDFEVPREWILPASTTTASVRIGGGFDVPVGGRVVTATIVDAYGRYYGEEQHHVMASLGVSFGLAGGPEHPSGRALPRR